MTHNQTPERGKLSIAHQEEQAAIITSGARLPNDLEVIPVPLEDTCEGATTAACDSDLSPSFAWSAPSWFQLLPLSGDDLAELPDEEDYRVRSVAPVDGLAVTKIESLIR